MTTDDELNGNDGGTPGAGEAQTLHDMLPEDLRSHESLKDFKDVSGLAKSFVNTQAMVGNSVRLPGEDAPQEEIDKFYSKLGRPEDPEKYELDNWEQPKGFVASEEMTKSFREVGFKVGLTQTQMNELNKWYGEQVNVLAGQVEERQAKGLEEGKAALKAEWGQAFDEKADAAMGAFKQFASEEEVAYLEEKGIGNNPTLVKVWAKVAEAMGEDGILNGKAGGMGGNLTPAQAKDEIAKMQKDPDFMKKYQDKAHADHKEAVEEMAKLFKLAYPE